MRSITNAAVSRPARSATLARVQFCPRKLWWGWVEIGRVVKTVAESDSSLESFLLWCSVHDYRVTTNIGEGNKATVMLHRRCCAATKVRR